MLYCNAINGRTIRNNLSAVTDFSDAMIFAMAVPNLIGLLILLPVVKEELRIYKERVHEVDQL